MPILKKDIAMEKGGKCRDLAALPTVLYSDVGRQIFTDLAQLNGSAPTQLALVCGIPPTNVSEELEIMVKEGLVEKDEEEERKYGDAFAFYSLTPAGFRIAHEFKLTRKKFFEKSSFEID
jgi:predicted transcriptional regulator